MYQVKLKLREQHKKDNASAGIHYELFLHILVVCSFLFFSSLTIN